MDFSFLSVFGSQFARDCLAATLGEDPVAPHFPGHDFKNHEDVTDQECDQVAEQGSPKGI